MAGEPVLGRLPRLPGACRAVARATACSPGSSPVRARGTGSLRALRGPGPPCGPWQEPEPRSRTNADAPAPRPARRPGAARTRGRPPGAHRRSTRYKRGPRQVHRTSCNSRVRLPLWHLIPGQIQAVHWFTNCAARRAFAGTLLAGVALQAGVPLAASALLVAEVATVEDPDPRCRRPSARWRRPGWPAAESCAVTISAVVSGAEYAVVHLMFLQSCRRLRDTTPPQDGAVSRSRQAIGRTLVAGAERVSQAPEGLGW